MFTAIHADVAYTVDSSRPISEDIDLMVSVPELAVKHPTQSVGQQWTLSITWTDSL